MTSSAVEALTRNPSSPFFIDEEVISWEPANAPHHSRGNRYHVFKNGPQVLPDLYAKRAAFPDNIFLVYEDTRWTYQQTFDKAAAIGAALVKQFGVTKGDRVCMLSRNYPEWIVAFIAATSIGAVAVPMNSWWTTEELQYGLDNCAAKVVFCDDERYARIAPVLSSLKALQCCVLMRSADAKKVGQGTVQFEELLRSHEGQPMPPMLAGKDDNAMIMYTSGTTGHPKGVVLTHRGVTCALYGLAFSAALKRVKRGAAGRKVKGDAAQQKAKSKKHMGQLGVLLNVPLFHATGLHGVFLTSFLIGRKIALMYKWDPQKALELIEKERITDFTGVPTMVMELMNSPDFKKRDVSSLRAIGGGGAPPPPSMLNQVRSTLPKARPVQGYGMTETNAVLTTTSDTEYVNRPTSCGRPVALVDVQIWSEDGKVLPPGTPGRIMARGPNIMKEYWKNPKATAETITPEGWLDTGDIGRLDEEGFLYIMDRAKDMIIRGGENISCAEVEAAVYEHPGVLEAAVIGLPHETLGEEVAVAIHPRPGHNIDLASIREVCSRLAKFKQPVAVFLWENEQLPRGATGKILKRQIREDIRKRSSTPVSKL